MAHRDGAGCAGNRGEPGVVPPTMADVLAVSPNRSSRSPTQAWAAPRHHFGCGAGERQPVRRPGGVSPTGSTARRSPPMPSEGTSAPGQPRGSGPRSTPVSAGRLPSARPEQERLTRPVPEKQTATPPRTPHRPPSAAAAMVPCRGLCACSVTVAGARPGREAVRPPGLLAGPSRQGAAAGGEVVVAAARNRGPAGRPGASRPSGEGQIALRSVYMLHWGGVGFFCKLFIYSMLFEGH